MKGLAARLLAGGVTGVLALAVAVVAGVGLTQNATHGDPKVDLSGLPDMPKERVRAYREAAGHRDLFQHLPCYCGCALLDEPHASLDRCFYAPDGTLEPHAAGCRICSEIALLAADLVHQGASHAEVRAQVDATFTGVGPATDTPLP
ncbi:MAG TPA: PCYCGC motif-containing (lipo)protein [Dehalococcoidia bacterium]|nr:PCYCGC motif-containing (lipo)protein [Dehalococcoidia bacterium]